MQHRAITITFAILLLSKALRRVHADENDVKCGIYMAKSSIPNAGYGLFAGTDFEPESELESSEWIGLFDYNTHNYDQPNNAEDKVLDNYWWETYGYLKYDTYDSVMLSTGVGTSANHFPYHDNVRYNAFDGVFCSDFCNFTSDMEQQELLDRNVNPGSGAFTQYLSSAIAVKPIVAGEEIFVDYGEAYLKLRDYGQPSLTEEDYERSADIVQKMGDYLLYENGDPDDRNFLFEVISLAARSLHDPKLEELLSDPVPFCSANAEELNENDELSVKNITQNLSKFDICDIPRGGSRVSLEDYLARIKALVHVLDERVSYALPDRRLDLETMYKDGITSLALNNRVRDVEWLEDNGLCFDNIERRESNIEDAGFGAFSTRHIPAGHTIAPAPLLHVSERSFMKMFRFYEEDGETIPYGRVRGYQLLINYCYGHNQSSILLCNTSRAGLINHSRTPNAKYRWSTWDSTEDWLSLSLADLKKTEERVLSLEIVALRDIKADEEVSICIL